MGFDVSRPRRVGAGAENSVGAGAIACNSELILVRFSCPSNSLKVRLSEAGNPMFYAFSDARRVARGKFAVTN